MPQNSYPPNPKLSSKEGLMDKKRKYQEKNTYGTLAANGIYITRFKHAVINNLIDYRT